MSYLHQHRKLAPRSVAGTLLALSLLAAACTSTNAKTGDSGSPSPHSDVSSGSAGSTGPVDAQLSAAKADVAKYSGAVFDYAPVGKLTGVSGLKGKTVWYVPIGEAAPILAAFGIGIKAAFDKVGIKTHVCDGKFLPTTIADCMNQAASQGADGVITGYVDYALVPTAFDNLVSHHVPVLVAGEAPDGGKTSSLDLAFLDGSPISNKMQQINAEAVIADSNGKAKILFIGNTDSPATKAGALAAKAFFKQHCSGCSVASIDYNTASLTKVPSQVSAALISHPDTTYVVPELDAAAAATVSGIKTAGYANKVKLASTSGGLDSLQRIKAGDVQFADVGDNPVYTGWSYADGMLRQLLGQMPEPSAPAIRIFTKDNVGDLDLTPAGYAGNSWFGSDAYERAFLTAWARA